METNWYNKINQQLVENKLMLLLIKNALNWSKVDNKDTYNVICDPGALNQS